MNKMNPDIKEKWLAALRSEEYLKGTGFLKIIHSEQYARYCCLGVLCDLHQKETGKGEWAKGLYISEGDYGSDKTLTPAVRLWAGIDNACGNLPDFLNGGHDKYLNKCALSTLNDAIPDSDGFELIAQAIEEFF